MSISRRSTESDLRMLHRNLTTGSCAVECPPSRLGQDAAQRQVLRVVAGHLAATGDLPKGWIVRLAFVRGVAAARVEAAAGRRVRGVRDVARQADAMGAA